MQFRIICSLQYIVKPNDMSKDRIRKFGKSVSLAAIVFGSGFLQHGIIDLKG